MNWIAFSNTTKRKVLNFQAIIYALNKNQGQLLLYFCQFVFAAEITFNQLITDSKQVP